MMNAIDFIVPTQMIALSLGQWLLYGLWACLAAAAVVVLFLGVLYGQLWFQAYMSGAKVSFVDLLGMSFRQIDARVIVKAKIMLAQAGLDTSQQHGGSTRDLEAQFLAGGNVENVVKSIIIAHRAGMNLDFDRAAAIDLAGRDLLEAVKTTVSPRVIDCPDLKKSKGKSLSAMARDGVELRIHARVTVRTNLDMLIGGASEETVIARVGEGIISAVGSAESHMHVMSMPQKISEELLTSGLDACTAYEIVSIDIARIDIGENIGARLRTDQAAADMRTAQAEAEGQRADAVARQKEMQALLAQRRAELLLAKSVLPKAIATAVGRGRLKNIYANQTQRIPMTAAIGLLESGRGKSKSA